MSLERNALMKKAFPVLKDYCRATHGMEFQVVDMRWGVRDEASDDHSTSALCMKEILNCQQVSMGPNFVAFIGQRYGFCPLPTNVGMSEMEAILDCLTDAGNNVDVLRKWYVKDENAKPPEYILQAKSKIGLNWSEQEGQIRALLRRGSQIAHGEGRLTEEGKHKYFMSVTEDEIMRGLLTIDNPGEHCVCFTRTLENVNTKHKKAWRFVDQVSPEEDEKTKKAIQSLKEKIKSKLPSSNYYAFTQSWSENGGMNEEDHGPYLDELCQQFETSVKDLIDRAKKQKGDVHKDLLFTEVLEHAHQCVQKCETFHGRDDILCDIKKHMLEGVNKPLVIHGNSGNGKTTIMAKVAQQLPVWLGDGDKLGIILRFLGTTSATSNIAALLLSLCKQILHIAGPSLRSKFPELTDDINELRRIFRDMLQFLPSDIKLVILLDSLDQLSKADGAHSLYWLPVELPINVRLVVSTLPVLLERLEYLLPETPECFIKVSSLDPSSGLDIVHLCLEQLGRTLNPLQEAQVSESLKACAQPLFIKLLFDNVSKWKSYDLNEKLPHSIKGIIEDLFQTLETKHGKLLVRRALGYISACKHGVTETEIEDMLSMDNEVLNDVFQYHLPPEHRLPSVLWARIRHDLSEYIVAREADDCKVLAWYHSQFVQEAAHRYLGYDKSTPQVCTNKDDSVAMLTNLSEYFIGTWGGGRRKPIKYTTRNVKTFKLSEPQTETNRHLPLQPAVFKSGRGGKGIVYNKRKISELPHLITQLEAMKDTEDMFYRNICFDLEMFMGWVTLAPLEDLTQRHIMINERRPETEEFTILAMMRTHMYEIKRRPSLLGNIANGLNRDDLNLRDLLDNFDHHRPKYCALVVPHPQIEGLFSGLVFVCSSHLGPVRDAVVILHQSRQRYVCMSQRIISVTYIGGSEIDVYPQVLPEGESFDFLSTCHGGVVAARSSPPVLCVFDTEREGQVRAMVNIADLVKENNIVIKGIHNYFDIKYSEDEDRPFIVRGNHQLVAIHPMSCAVVFSLFTEESKGCIVMVWIVAKSLYTVLYAKGAVELYTETQLLGKCHLGRDVVCCTESGYAMSPIAFTDCTVMFLDSIMFVQQCVKIAEQNNGFSSVVSPPIETFSIIAKQSTPGVVHHLSTPSTEGTCFVACSTDHITVYQAVSPAADDEPRDAIGMVLVEKCQARTRCTAAHLSIDQTIVLAYIGGTVEVFNVRENCKELEKAGEFHAHSLQIKKLLLPFDLAEVIVTCSDDGITKSWRPFEAINKSENPFDCAANAIDTIRIADDTVLTSSRNPKDPCLLWSRLSGRITQALPHPQEKAFVATYLSPDGRQVLTLDVAGEAHCWSLGKPREGAPETEHGLCIESRDKVVNLLDTETMERQRHISVLAKIGLLLAEPDGSCHIISYLTRSMTSFKLADPENERESQFCRWTVVRETHVVGMIETPPSLSVYDTTKETGRSLSLLNITKGTVLDLKPTNSGTELCVLCESLVFIDVATCDVTANVSLHGRAAQRIHTDVRGKILLVVGNEDCWVIDPTTHTIKVESMTLEGEADESLQCLSPDGNYFLYVTGKTCLSIMRTMDGTHLGTHVVHDVIQTMAVSDDNWYVMCSTSDKRMIFLLIVDPDEPEHAQRIQNVRSKYSEISAKATTTEECDDYIEVVTSRTCALQ